jgi:hypothetical protein
MREILFSQRLFGSLNMFIDPTKRSESDYVYLKNGRSRFNRITVINKPLKFNDDILNATQNKQSISYLGNNLVLVADGNVFIKDLSIVENGKFMSPFRRVVPLTDDAHLDPNAKDVFTVNVPASTINYARKIGADGKIIFDIFSSPSPMCMVLQDGHSRPLVLTPDGTLRIANSYNDWTIDNREYVPIGKFMIYSNGILYIVSPDNKRIYRSVTGRPLDFMVVIDKDGNKLPDINAGGVEAVSFQVDLDDITCIANVNNQSNGFLLTTKRSTYMIIPDYSITLFGEPTYNFVKLFDTGAINYKSVLEILGDVVFISDNGLRSFNAIANSKFHGQNSIFSKSISAILDGIKQSEVSSCCSYCDDYALFSLNSSEGNIIAVYDMLTQAFSAIDCPSVNGVIKQMVFHPYVGKVFYLTDKGEIGILYDSVEHEECTFIAGDFVSGDGRANVRPVYARVSFFGNEPGIMKYCSYTDGVQNEKGFRYVYINPKESPVIVLPLEDSYAGWRTRLQIQWNFDITISSIEIVCDIGMEKTNPSQKVMSYRHLKVHNIRHNLTDNVELQRNMIVGINGEGFIDVKGVYIGSIQCKILDKNNSSMSFIVSPDCEIGNYPVYLVTDTGYLEIGNVNIVG